MQGLLCEPGTFVYYRYTVLTPGLVTFLAVDLGFHMSSCVWVRLPVAIPDADTPLHREARGLVEAIIVEWLSEVPGVPPPALYVRSIAMPNAVADFRRYDALPGPFLSHRLLATGLVALREGEWDDVALASAVARRQATLKQETATIIRAGATDP